MRELGKKLGASLLIALASFAGGNGFAQTTPLTSTAVNQLYNSMAGAGSESGVGAVLNSQGASPATQSPITPSRQTLNLPSASLPLQKQAGQATQGSSTDSTSPFPFNGAPLADLPPSLLEQEFQPQLPVEDAPPLQQVGYNQLRASRFDYDPIANPGLPESYLLGPGDELVLHDGLGDRGQSLGGVVPIKIDADGQLHIPGMQPLQAWNLTLDQLNQELAKKTKFLYATLGRVRSIQVNLAGEVISPGAHNVPGTTTVVNALALMGGIKKTGSLRHVRWLRGRVLVREIDLYDYLLEGQISTTLRLQSGDTLFIPLLKQVAAVAGSVRRPGIYEIRGEETLADLVERAGGVLPGISLSKTQLERRDPLQGTTLKSLTAEELRQTPTQDQDLLKLLPRPTLRTVRIEGEAIQNPGVYPLLPGTRLGDLIVAAGNLKFPESTDPKVLLTRWEYSTRKTQRRVFGLNLNPETLETEPDIELKDGDAFTVRLHSDFQKSIFLKLSGEFRYPGTYEVMPGERLADLIRRAGGFTDQAFLKAAVFTRQSIADRERVINKRLDVDIDKALLQSTVRAPSSLTSPQTQLAAVQEIRAGYASVRETEAQQLAANETARTASVNDSVNGVIGASILSTQQQQDQQTQTDNKNNTNNFDASNAVGGRILIQLQDLDAFEDTPDNLRLEDGDELLVPTFENTVLVKGETFGEAAIPIVPERNVKDYLDFFGGFRDSANPEDIYIIRANGQVVADAYPSQPVEAGDTIVVPPNLTPQESVIKESATVVDVIFKTVSTIAVLYTIGILVP